MTTVKACIAKKPAGVYSLPSSASVLQALQMMRDRKVRAVLAIDDDALQGIVSQGDCAIKVLLAGRDPSATRLDAIMTRAPLTVVQTDTLDHCMKTMVTRSIRHLPVEEEGRVLGMVSIGDIVKEIMEMQGQHIRYLETDIKGHSGEY